MEAEQKKQPIKDAFMADLLKEDAPSGVVAGDRAKQTNPADSQVQEDFSLFTGMIKPVRIERRVNRQPLLKEVAMGAC